MVLLTVSLFGEKFISFVIGSTHLPRCFRSLKQKNYLLYVGQIINAWMLADVFYKMAPNEYTKAKTEYFE